MCITGGIKVRLFNVPFVTFDIDLLHSSRYPCYGPLKPMRYPEL